MHRALAVEDILYEILGFLLPDARPTLLTLATTCRLFQQVALDLLWKELDNLCPIGYCLPQDAVGIKSNSLDEHDMRVECTRVCTYGC